MQQAKIAIDLDLLCVVNVQTALLGVQSSSR